MKIRLENGVHEEIHLLTSTAVVTLDIISLMWHVAYIRWSGMTVMAVAPVALVLDAALCLPRRACLRCHLLLLGVLHTICLWISNDWGLLCRFGEPRGFLWCQSQHLL